MSASAGPLDIRESTANVGDGASLFYKEAGAGSPVLLIHGGGPSSRGWSPIFESLSNDHRVVVYDRRGYGQSAGAPLGQGWRRHGEDAAELLQSLKATPAQIVTWSAGGYVGVHLAVEHPELVRSLVLIEMGLPRPPALTASGLAMLAQISVLRRLSGDRAAIDAFMRWVTREDMGNTWDRPDYPEERKQRTADNCRGIWADFDSERPDLSEARLARVRCPVTCVIGAMGQDWFPRSADAVLRAMGHGELVVVPGVNHAITHHFPDRVTDVIRSELEKQAQQ